MQCLIPWLLWCCGLAKLLWADILDRDTSGILSFHFNSIEMNKVDTSLRQRHRETMEHWCTVVQKMVNANDTLKWLCRITSPKRRFKKSAREILFFQKWNTGIIFWRIVPEIVYHCFVSVGSITTLKQLAGYSQDVIIHCSRYSLISWGNMSVPNCQWVVTHKTWSLIWFTKDCMPLVSFTAT